MPKHKRSYKLPSRRALKKHLDRLYAKHPYCHYCEIRVDHDTRSVDHVIPLSRGGSNKQDNVVLACQKCNGEKADMTADEYAIVKEDKKYKHLILGPYISVEPERTTFSLNLSYGR